jgi:hypothetical protein
VQKKAHRRRAGIIASPAPVLNCLLFVVPFFQVFFCFYKVVVCINNCIEHLLCIHAVFLLQISYLFVFFIVCFLTVLAFL